MYKSFSFAGVCVAGYSSPKNEILELQLPLKLFAGNKQGLCPERDFKVQHGGFCDEPVECLRHIFETRNLVTSGDAGSKLLVWDLGEDDSGINIFFFFLFSSWPSSFLLLLPKNDLDVIKRTGVINLRDTAAEGRKISSGLTEVPSVLHGSRISDVQLTELASGKTLYAVGTDSLNPVSGLQFINASAFIICATNGTLCVGDTRDPSVEHYALQEDMSRSHWTFGLKTNPPQSDLSSCSVSRLSSCGQVLVSDLRKMSSPVTQAQLNLQHSFSSSDFLTVRWAPVLDNCLSVSGFDGTVLVFDTTSWTTDLKNPEPIFVHRGHSLSCEVKTDDPPLVVTTHVWHPWRPRTLLSAASDGSLHVWDWVGKDNISV
ncbi:hypothetical protein NFI96_018399 [Prochilodus magdalenae]|nr:hypothetical protein NFI96_018399 [Prochilodus magdalenae]